MSIRPLEFLVRFLVIWLISVSAFGEGHLERTQGLPIWVIQASDPGPDLPPTGQSLFDKIFLKQSTGYAIPYPFDALIRFLEQRIANGTKSKVSHTLIPIGRSLQRDAAAPDYFKSPRSILSLAGEPVELPGRIPEVLKYRLFIGHQAKAEAMEVISYNNRAGRFEFQVVEDYRADARPRVRPANRAICMACHQNGAPIFSRAPWSETNFNSDVALELMRAQPEKYPSFPDTISGAAEATNLAVGLANYLAPSQLFWRSGCGKDIAGEDTSFRCRAAILQAILQYRLSAELVFDSNSQDYQSRYVSTFFNNWNDQWPGGVFLAGAEIPDRNPFDKSISDTSFDPLLPRPARAFWDQPTLALAQGTVNRLAGFLALGDIERLDQRLVQLSRQHQLEKIVYRSDCKLLDTAGIQSGLFRFQCGEPNSAEVMTAIIEIARRKDDIISLDIQNMHLPGDQILWKLGTTNLVQRNTNETSQIIALPTNLSGNLSPRLANGNRINEISLTWDENPTTTSSLPDQLKLEMSVVVDFILVQEALDKMVIAANSKHSNALSSLPFRRQAIVSDLEKHLGMEARSW